MVSIVKIDRTTTDKTGTYIMGDLRCLSTDTKPTEIEDYKVGNGCTCVEINTGKLFLYDLDSKTWKEV